MTPPPPRHQLKADDVWAVEAELFDSEVLCLAVENCNADAVSTWRLHCHSLKAARFPHVNYVGEFRLL